MVYASWSVVANEQPSTAKWNIIGTDLAYFDSIVGQSGSNVVLKGIPYQADTTNSVRSSVLIQHGYGVLSPGVAANANETVTFPTAYSAIPIVLISAGGDDTAGSTSLGQGNVEANYFLTEATGLTSTNFNAVVRVANGANWAVGTTVFYHWLSIGAS